MRNALICALLALIFSIGKAQKPWESLAERLRQGDMPFLADPVTSDPDSASVGVLQANWPPEDLALLRQYKGKLMPMITDSLCWNTNNDERWLYLGAYLRYRKSRIVLRRKLLSGERLYAWEGSDTTRLETYFAEDQQYPSAMMHLALARWASGKRKGPPIRLGPYWKNRLQVMASWCSMENTEACYYRWLMGKLGM
jgi:hypothetical protein